MALGDRGNRHGGGVVVVVGPDGAGKSRLTMDLREALANRLGTSVSIVNFRSRHLDRVFRRRHDQASLAQAAANPHGTPVRGVAAASAKAIALWADFVLSATAWRRRGDKGVTLVERYAYDVVVDPRAFGAYSSPETASRACRHASVPRRTPSSCAARQPQSFEVGRQTWTRVRSHASTERGTTCVVAIDVPFIEVETTAPVDADALSARLLAVLGR